MEKKGLERKGPDRAAAPAPAADGSRDRKAALPAPPARSRKPVTIGLFVAIGAVGAWLLRRERPRAPEGTWRDLLSSDERGNQSR